MRSSDYLQGGPYDYLNLLSALDLFIFNRYPQGGLYDYLNLSRDTPVTPYARPPVSTDSATRDRLRDCRNLRQSTAICYILPCPAEFCQVLLGL